MKRLNTPFKFVSILTPLLIFLLISMIFTFSACDMADGGSSSPGSGDSSVSVTGVDLNKSSLSLVVGTTKSLIPTVSPANASVKSVTWRSSNSAVAEISASGVITGKSAGTVTITVSTTDGSKTATCSLTVTATAVSVTGVTVNKSTLSLVEGACETLNATIAPSTATNDNISWSSNNSAVAEVSSAGKVTAKSAGTATITVTTEDGTKTATCTVTVTPPPVCVTGVTLNKSSLTLTAGGNETLVATVNPNNATNKNMVWDSNNTAVAEVNVTGKVTAKTPGSCTITVTTEDGSKKATCSLTVNPVSVTGVSLNKTTLILNEGNNETLTATVAPGDATNKNISWSSNNSTVATVSTNGLVTGKSVGTATITVTTADGSKTANCAVTVNPAYTAVTGVSLNKSSTVIYKGNTETLTATITPTGATNKNVSWTTSNSAIATVSTAGVVTPVAVGTATITCTTQDQSKSATCSVEVKEPVVIQTVRLQWPESVTSNVNVTTIIYGRVLATGVTGYGKPVDPRIKGQLCYYNNNNPGEINYVDVQINLDYIGITPQEMQENEYQGNLSCSSPGTYTFYFRFSGDGGLTYPYVTPEKRTATISQ